MKHIASDEQFCRLCENSPALDFEISFAFQPIVNSRTREVIAQEALVRGADGSPASEVFKHVNADNLYRFDQTCRTRAIALAARLGLDRVLNLNFSPNAVYRPELCIRSTIHAADQHNFPVKDIVFEVSEMERVEDNAHLLSIFQYYREMGFRTAIDDFGAGHSGLNLLADFQPTYLKLDRKLISDINTLPSKQAIARGVFAICRELSVELLAEGVETREEYQWLAELGIELFQGYYFARPGFEALPGVDSQCFE